MSIQHAKHLRVAPEDLCENVVVCGDPARAKHIASFMDQPRLVGENREYHSWMGTFGGHKIAAVSHGVGAAGAAICFQELIDLGAKRLIRVGTAGALQDDLEVGDAVVATAAVRLDGVSHMMVPPEFPAFADPALFQRLRHRCASGFSRTHTGVILTTALFYGSLLPDHLALYQQAGVLAVEMETSALFVIGALRKVETACVVVLDGNPRRWKEGMYHPDGQAMARGTDAAIRAALEALAGD
jgi:uridine phosphorylase